MIFLCYQIYARPIYLKFTQYTKIIADFTLFVLLIIICLLELQVILENNEERYFSDTLY